MLLEKHVVSGRYSVCRWCGLRQLQCWEVGGEESDKLHFFKKKKELVLVATCSAS